MDVREAGRAWSCRAQLPPPAPKGAFLGAVLGGCRLAVPGCSDPLLVPCSVALCWGAAGCRGRGRVGGVGGAVVESLWSCGWGVLTAGGVSAVRRKHSQGGRAVGEPWVRAQPPAPAVKVEFTPSRAGPTPLFSVSVTAVKLFSFLFLVDAEASGFVFFFFFKGWVFEGFYNLPCWILGRG